MVWIAETERLTLETIGEHHAAFILEMFKDPDFIRFIGDRRLRNLEHARTYIRENYQQHQVKNGYSMYIVKEKKAGKLIGMCGLVNRSGLDGTDLGFAFLAQNRGSGLAFEAAQAVIEHARKSLGLDQLLAIAQAGNSRSVKLLEKLGFKFEKVITLAQDPHELLLFRKAL